MAIKVPTANISHEEWLRMRQGGIGGSDAGGICGLNPYASPMSVYHEKVSRDVGDIDNEAMRQGRDLEEYVAKRFMEATGLKVRRSNAMYRSEEHPFMIADVDRLIVGEDAGLECKTASPYNSDKWKEEEIPPHYVIQCYHYMAVTGRKAWYIAVVILGQGFKFRKLSWDEELVQDLISIEENFWNNHVVPRVMPDPDGSEISEEVINRYYPRASRETIALPAEFDQQLRRREEILELEGRLAQERKLIDQKIKMFMGEYEAAANERYRVSWSNVDTVRIDSRRLKQEQPELYRSFSMSSQSRRFTVKAA